MNKLKLVLAEIERLKEDARVNEVQAHADPSANNNEDDDSWLDQMVGDFLIENSSFDIFEFVDPGLQSSTVLTSAEEASEERLSQGEECKVRSEVFEDTLLNAECHDQSKNPKCHDQSEDSDCYNISTEFVDTNLLQSCRNGKRACATREHRNIKILKSKGKRKDSQGGHRFKEDDIKTYTCDVCHRQFNRKENLIPHLRTHSGKKPYKCTVCQRAFSQSGHLRIHMRIHSGERPYECKVCQKAFSDSSALRRHLRIHSGEKPYECTVCQKAFSQSSNLSTHLRLHSGKKKVSAL